MRLVFANAQKRFWSRRVQREVPRVMQSVETGILCHKMLEKVSFFSKVADVVSS